MAAHSAWQSHLGEAAQRVGDAVDERRALAAAAGEGVGREEGGGNDYETPPAPAAGKMAAAKVTLRAPPICEPRAVGSGHGMAALGGTHCLSASAPTTVPKIMLEPKPAMNSRPMSPRSKP